MYLSKFRFNDLLLFLVAFPLIALSGILHGGRLVHDFHILYLGVFALLFLWLGGRLFSKEDHFSSKQAPLLILSLSSFYVLCAFQLLSFLAGTREGLTTQDPYLTYKALPVIFTHILLFFFFLDAFRSSRTITYYFNCLFLLVSALSLLGLLQDIIPNIWRKKMFFTITINMDFYSTFFNNDHFAFFLNLILPLAAATTLWEVITRYSWHRPLATLFHIARRPLALKIVGVFIIGITTGWTGSRSGSVSIGIALSLVILLLLLVTWKKAKNRLPLLISILAVSSLLVPLLLLFTGVPNALKQIYWWYNHIGNIVTGSSYDGSYDQRIIVYKSLLPPISQHPFFGVGIGTFLTSFAPYTPPEAHEPTGAHALSDHLQLIFETGMMGFALMLIVPLIVLVRRLLAYCKKWSDISSDRLILLIGSLGGLVAAGIHSATDFSLRVPTVMLTFLSIAAIPFSLFLQDETVSRRVSRSLATLFLILLVVVNGVIFELPFQAEKIAKEGPHVLTSAIRLDPLNPDYRIALMRRDIAKSRWPEEENTIKEIIRISPIADTYNAVGVMLSIKGNVDKTYPARAVPYLEKAVSLVPMADGYLVDLAQNQTRLAKIAEDKNEDPAPYLETIRRFLERRILLEQELKPTLKRAIKASTARLATPLFQKKVQDLLEELSSSKPIVG